VGIVTDRDLRCRVVAAELGADAAVGRIMTAPAFCVRPDQLGAEVLFAMLERGIRHAPVVAEGGRLIGVVEESDLVEAQPRSWFSARTVIDRAQSPEELGVAARSLAAIVVDLHQARVAPVAIGRVLSALGDALSVRAIELAGHERVVAGQEGLVWVALDSHARRELTARSAPCGALVAEQPPPAQWLTALCEVLQRAGLQRRLPVRSPQECLAAACDDQQTLPILFERRTLWGAAQALPALPSSRREEIIATLRRRARAAIPPTGFDGDRVIEPDGSRSSLLDLRTAVVLPIVELARWAGAAAGLAEGSTPERLAAAQRAGALCAEDATALTDAFEWSFDLRMIHHAERLADGAEAQDAVEVTGLSRLARDGLREVFRAVTAAQRRLGP
jgi:CBS domain-containing protein